MSRAAGFTLIEALIVMVVVGMITAFTLPRIRSALYATNARSARVAFGTLAAKARSAARQRGCTATLNVTGGATGRVWVTVCKVSSAGTDTLGVIDPLAQRFNISISATSGALQFDPRGLSVGYLPLTVRFTSTAGGSTVTDSAMINQLGKVTR
jgi:prepilin-type N-terminal cleavage/methylation domain-containing protein